MNQKLDQFKVGASRYFKVLWRELHKAITDKQVLLTLFVVPVVLLVLLSVVLSGVYTTKKSLSHINMAIVFDVNELDPQAYLKGNSAVVLVANGALKSINDIRAMDFKKLMLDDFLKAASEKALITTREMPKEKALAAVKSGELDAAVIFDDAFYGNYVVNTVTPLKNPTSLQIVTNNNNHLKRQIAETLMMTFANRMERSWHIRDLSMQEVVAPGIEQEVEITDSGIGNLLQGGQIGQVLTFEMQLVQGKKAVTSQAYYAVGMLTLFLLFTCSYVARSMFEDHKNVKEKWSYFWSKGTLLVALGGAQIATVFAFAKLAYKVDFGNTINLAYISFSSLFAFMGIGLLIGAFSMKIDHVKVINMLEGFVFQLMAFLGGSFIPLADLPLVFKYLSHFTPNGITMSAYIYNIQGNNVWKYAQDLWVLIGVGLVTTLIAAMLYKSSKVKDMSR